MILNLVSFCSIWFDDQTIRGSFPLHLAAALLAQSAHHHWLELKQQKIFLWLSQFYLYDYHKCICIIITIVFPSRSCSSCRVCPTLANTKAEAASIWMTRFFGAFGSVSPSTCRARNTFGQCTRRHLGQIRGWSEKSLTDRQTGSPERPFRCFDYHKCICMIT